MSVRIPAGSGTRPVVVASPALDRTALVASATAVRDALRAASRDGADACQLTATAYEQATLQTRERFAHLPPAERFDVAVALAFHALNGPGGHVAQLRLADSGRTRAVSFLAELQAHDASGELWAGADLDSTQSGGSLDPRLADGTKNQAFHTNFFIAAGYVAADDPVRMALVLGGNLFHETLDEKAWRGAGGHMRDWSASVFGQLAGRSIFDLRHQQKDPRLAPAAVTAFMGKPGTQPPATGDAGLDGHSRDVTSSLRRLRDNDLTRAIVDNPVVKAVIGIANAIAPLLRKLLPGKTASA